MTSYTKPTVTWKFRLSYVAAGLGLLLLAGLLSSVETGGASAPAALPAISPGNAAPAKVLLLQGTSTPTTTPTSTPTPAPTLLPNARFGFGINLSIGDMSEYDVTQLGAGWYSDWYSLLDPPRPGCLDYVHKIYTAPDAVAVNMTTKTITWSGWDYLKKKIAANPGAVWFIGNEPDCTLPESDNRLPEEYAVIYHEFYTFIKGRDATALIANGAIVEGTPMRLQYLDRVWNAYQTYYGSPMPVDVWNMHNQIAREEYGNWGAQIPPGFPLSTPGALYLFEQNDNLEIFIQHVVNMRTWMKNHGQQNKPLIISEYGVLFTENKGFTVDRVNEFMTNTFRYLIHATDANLGYPADGNRLVQRWIWFSINEPPSKWNGALFDYTVHEYPGVLTTFGANYRDFVANPYKASPTPWGTPAPMTTIREAEAGSVVGDARIVADTSVSNCAYVDTPSDSAGGDVQVSAYLPEAGKYYVFIRMMGPDVNSNSFWVSVDGGTEYSIDRSPASGWGWQRLMNVDGTAIISYTLSAGWHRIKVNQKEVRARVDAIAMSNDANLSLGIPRTCQTPTPTPSPTPQPSYSIPLQAGWNLVSFPICAASNNPRALLSPIEGSYDLAYAWDSETESWESFFPALPDPQSLLWVSRSRGLWLHATAAATLPVTGCPPGSQTLIPLRAGWNLVGYPATAARDVTSALSSIAGKVTMVFSYDSTRPSNPWRKYNPTAPAFASDLTSLEPGRGYWIHASEACSWFVPY